MKVGCLKKQRGVAIPLVTIVLPVLLLAAGWALDSGHAFVDKTRVQNAVDASALSAAITINRDITKNTAAAATAGVATFDTFKATIGNNELAGLDGGDLVFEYSNALDPFAPGTNPPLFVRVTSAGMLEVPRGLTMISSMITGNDPAPLLVTAIATAGPVGQNCSLVPFVMCADIPPPPTPVDTICSDGACFGYTVGQIRSLTIACNGNNSNCPPNSLESGNFNLLDLDGSQGGKDIRDTLQGTTNVCLQGNTLNTKPGWTWGNVRKGIDDRFDSDTQTVEYKLPSYNPTAYTQYQPAGNGRRVMAVPVGNCTGIQNGNSTIPKVGVACVFLTEHAINAGPQKKIMMEFTGDSCQQNGTWDPNNPVLNGPYKIVLYRSTGSKDS
ncbi:TadE/TadG family type IV pilus assembly protein [Methyloglobulus sp.]|uniref:TadE/TadG family type IV pilus assembly protein n=1 Tax=Methyloglobulus sp. TaxID=2518622 RepID=UPI003988EE24